MTSNDNIHPYMREPLPKAIQDTFNELRTKKKGIAVITSAMLKGNYEKIRCNK